MEHITDLIAVNDRGMGGRVVCVTKQKECSSPKVRK